MYEELDTKNIFKDEWDDSDAFFVVERTKFHVHRALLSLMSPVFKAMFSSDFREKVQREISLPGKKAEVFLSFLLIVYSREDFDEVTSELLIRKSTPIHSFQCFFFAKWLCTIKMELQDGVLRLGVDFRYLAWWHDFLDVSFFLHAFALWHSNSLLAYFWKKTNTALIQHCKAGVLYGKFESLSSHFILEGVKSPQFYPASRSFLAGYLSLWKMSNVPSASYLFSQILRDMFYMGIFFCDFQALKTVTLKSQFFLLVPFRLSFPFLSPFVSSIILCSFTFE